MTAPADLSVFCGREFPRLVGALDLYLGDLAVAQEIAQEALIKAASRWERVSGLDSPSAWTRRVALNMATSHLRRRTAERHARARLAAMAHPVAAEEEVGAYADVRQAVAALPDKQRQAVILRFFLDMTADQAATSMGCSADAVRALTSRASVHLRQRLLPLRSGEVSDG